jgi:transcription-repair coupling factor (superfamily II helicase)
VADAAELGDFQNELLDRFGKPPDVVERLLVLTWLRIQARRWLIDRIRMENRYLVLDYLAPRLIRQLADSTSGRLRVADQRSAYLLLEPEVREPDQILARIELLLRCG